MRAAPARYALAAFLLILAAATTRTASATVIHVPSGEPTVAAGIAAASPGDTVRIACDTYYEHDLSVAKQITIESASGDPSCVTIDADGDGRVMYVSVADGVVLRGITFANGFAAYGAGVIVYEVDVEIRSCRFTGNHATGECGGLRCQRNSVQISDCLFNDNTSDSGTGGCELDDVHGLIENCTFDGNDAPWGAGLSIYRPSTVTLDGCVFQDNYAWGPDSYGGGAYCYSDAAPTFTGCTFGFNESDFCGGGLGIDTNCAATVQNCSFTGNTAVHGGGFYVWLCGAGGFDECTFTANVADSSGGGGLLEWGGGVYVTNSTFTGNEALTGGGLNYFQTTGGPVDCTFYENSAYYGGAITYGDCASAWATGCTMVRNGAVSRQAHGAGVAMVGWFDVALDRCIIAFSTAGEAAVAAFGTVTATACVVHGNAGGDWTEALAGQESLEHNTGADPLFCDVMAPDLTLCYDSPCLPWNNTPFVQIGAHGEGCGACGPAVERTTWGSVKAKYR
ncbi:MAG: right-handed parallel beta-helix repeat-containing protein [Candidatus Eisenbacteria bacterium]